MEQPKDKRIKNDLRGAYYLGENFFFESKLLSDVW
jgi:hypothetical protein